jgi:hypothetical protein
MLPAFPSPAEVRRLIDVTAVETDLTGPASGADLERQGRNPGAVCQHAANVYHAACSISV